MEKKWYQKAWFMWVMLFLFFPIGIFLLWKYSEYSKTSRIIITAIFIILAIVGMSGNKNGAKQSNQQPTIRQEQPASNSSSSNTSSQKESQKKETSTVPTEYKNALIKAGMYGKQMHMSKAGIYRQLTSEYGEKFSAAAAQYAIDNLKIDYKKEALAKGKQYQKQQAMSTNAVYNQLISSAGEQFTEEEAKYAIDHLND